MAPSSAFVAGPALPLRRAPGVSVTSVAPRRPAGVAAPRMMADKKGGLFGIKMPSMPFGGDKNKAAAKADTAAKKTKAAVNQFQANAATAAKKTAEAPKKVVGAPKLAVEKVEEAFMELQPGDAGYVEPKAKSTAAQAVSSAKSAASDVGSAAKSAGSAIKAATPSNVKKAVGKAADAVEDAADSVVEAAKKPAKRGAALLREDFLKSAPERIGVGRQDLTEVAPPTYGEPGYVRGGWRRGWTARVGSGSRGGGWGRRGRVDGYRCGRRRGVSVDFRAEAEMPRQSSVECVRVRAVFDRSPGWCLGGWTTRHHVGKVGMDTAPNSWVSFASLGGRLTVWLLLAVCSALFLLYLRSPLPLVLALVWCFFVRYKYSAYETAKQSTLGISSFSDDANAAEKVGGLAALKKAALEAKKGATAAELKAKAVRMEKAVLKAAANEEKKDVLPSYLLPLPEDTPRKYGTWKNY